MAQKTHDKLYPHNDKGQCKESHCHTCGYDYDDPKFVENHQEALYNSSPWSIKKRLEESNKPILDTELYNEQIHVVYKAMEDNIIAQKLCGECLKPRPEDIVELINDGWNIVQKPMTSSMNNNTLQVTFHIEQWWLCKKCQENL